METPKDHLPGESEDNASPKEGSEVEQQRPRRAPLNAEGMERPKFLLDYPEDPALERLIAAFESGNFALIRTEADKLAQTTEDAAVRDAALELRRRIDPDPLAKYLLAISLVLLLVLTLWAYSAH